jgi:hypothetical protein
MTEFAAIVLAHTDPPQLRRLVTALEDVPVFLHCDARTPRSTLQEMVTGLPRRVTLLPRLATRLSSWSLVAAELAGARAALTATGARHIAVMSGADYPLVSMQTLAEELTRWKGHSYLWNLPMPFSAWDTPRHPDGGFWRLQRRFLTRGDNVLFWREIPLRWPVPRALPEGIELRASSQWKIYARHHLERLLDVVDVRPDLVRFWRSTLVPDETFVASILASRTVMGDAAIAPCRAHAWFIRWPATDMHPEWLRGADFDLLAEARWAAAIGPDEAFEPWAEPVRPARRLFARKFSSHVDPDVLDRIDAELRT